MTTRLSNHTKDASLQQLLGLLNNVVRFVDLPVKDRTRMLGLWNNKFPADLTKSISILGTYEMYVGGVAIQDHMRWATVVNGKLLTARIDLDDLTPLDRAKIIAGEIQSALSLGSASGKKIQRAVAMDMQDFRGQPRRECSAALEITPEYLTEWLGASEAESMLEWMETCAQMFGELKSAKRILEDIFKMAKTAGQIKRMVPELMQYLPEKNRAAFEDQKRSSTVPFEWAPYDKSKIGDMLLQVSKGHLLTGMGKPRNDSSVCSLEHQTWAMRCEWGVPIP